MKALRVLMVVPAFMWKHNPPLQTGQYPWPSSPVYRYKNVAGFRLSYNHHSWVLPQGTQLLVPVHVAPTNTLPDFSKL